MNIQFVVKNCKECPCCIYNHEKEIGFCNALKRIIADTDKVNCKQNVFIRTQSEPLLPRLKDLP